MKKDIPFWHSFRGEGLRKLGFKFVDSDSDETGEVLTFKNNKMYVNPIKLVVRQKYCAGLLIYTIQDFQ